MNKQSVQKLKLFSMGLAERFIENKIYFIDIETKFFSGAKEYKGQAVLEGEKLKYNFVGNTKLLHFEEFIGVLEKEWENYDKTEIIYRERGTTILIEGDNKNVKTKYLDSVNNINQQDNTHINTSTTVLNRNYLIKVGQANKLLQEIGILTKDGKVKNDMIRKYNQIDYFIELVEGIVKDFPLDREITVIDCGCGKSYLSFVLNYYIREVLKRPCYFIGLDYSQGVIEASKRMASNLGYNNMEFKATDIENYFSQRRVDMVISLHACDTATDQAIALGINNNAEAIIAVPCCQREILNQYEFGVLKPILNYGILKARLADVLTDGIRSLILEAKGYNTSIVEYISPLESPKNLMIKAIKNREFNKKAREEYKELKKMLKVEPTLERLIGGLS